MIYAHIPEIQIEGGEYSFGNSKLINIGFDKFSELDRFWAKPLVFERGAPVFWVEYSDDFDQVYENLDMLHLMIGMITGRASIHPRLSIAYKVEVPDNSPVEFDPNQEWIESEICNLTERLAMSTSLTAVTKKIGVCNRSLVLATSTNPIVLNQEALNGIKTFLANLKELKARSNHWIFQPIKMLQSIEVRKDKMTRFLITTVALEGLLLSEEKKGGIANNLALAMCSIMKLDIQSERAQSLNSLIKEVYDARSCIVHCRPCSQQQLSKAGIAVGILSTVITGAIFEAMKERGLDFDSDENEIRAIWSR